MAEPILSHDRITAEGAEPQQWLYVLHGIYGMGRNWASVIRRVVRERPDWGALLVDLRQHGASQGFAAPHTVEAAAADLVALSDSTGLRPAAVLGHSFGGKVALVHAGLAPEGLRQVWVIDSTPEAREPGGSAWTMLQLIESLPDRFDTREDLVNALMAHGQVKPVAQWMATNLEPVESGGLRWRFDFNAIRDLLHSFFETDAWQVVEDPPAGMEIHLVRAEESSVLGGDALARAERAAAGSEGRTHLHTIAGGHWVNAENPGAIEALLVQMLPSE